MPHPKFENSRLGFIESVHERQWQMRHPSSRLAPGWALLHFQISVEPYSPKGPENAKNNNTISMYWETLQGRHMAQWQLLCSVNSSKISTKLVGSRCSVFGRAHRVSTVGFRKDIAVEYLSCFLSALNLDIYVYCLMHGWVEIFHADQTMCMYMNDSRI